MDIPDWAPKCLRDRYLAGLEEEKKQSGEGSRILGKLITREEMREVWLALGRRSNQEDDAWQFVVEVYSALAPPHWEEYTRGQKRAKCDRIAQLAAELRELVADTGLGSYIWKRAMEGEKIDWARYYILAHSKVSLKRAEAENLWEVLWESMALHHPDYTMETALNAFWGFLNDLEKYALALKKEPAGLLTRPNDPRAHLHYFVRSLTASLRKRYGESLRRVVAVTASVIWDLDPPLTEAEVTRLTPDRGIA